jgi:hypothetical protein
MKIRLLTAIAFTAMAMISCNEDTNNIGASLTQNTDQLKINTGIFEATSKSILADSVYARNFDCYFGLVKDPETETYVQTEFMTQFGVLEDMILPDEDQMASLDDQGKIVADSCELWLYFDKSNCYGDSLTPMKMNVMELERAMDSEAVYYSNYDPEDEGYIRPNGIQKELVFTLANLTYSDSLRYTKTYSDIARVTLNDEYKDKDGKVYSNFGTYLLRNFYEHQEYFKNSYTFVHNLCPGFYFKLLDGLGVMAKMGRIELNIHYRYKSYTDDNIHRTVLTLASTPEVLQTVKVTNETAGLKRLVNDNSCTYLKSPAGTFTEVTLPVDEIMDEHWFDYLLSVSMSFQRLNSQDPYNKYNFPAPTTILLLPKDSLNTFFEKEKTYDYKRSYVATLVKNNYSFTNLGDLITNMYRDKVVGLYEDPEWIKKHPDWNKVVLVPIVTPSTVTTSTNNTTTTSTTTAISHQIGLTSTQLVGGENSPIEVKVIYAKFL